MPETLIKFNPEISIMASVPFVGCVGCAALTGNMRLFIENLIRQGVPVVSGVKAQVDCSVKLGKKRNIRRIDITLGDMSASRNVGKWDLRNTVHCGIKD